MRNDTTRRSPRELKSLIEAGRYRPSPEGIAVAMLRHAGVRGFLFGRTAGR